MGQLKLSNFLKQDNKNMLFGVLRPSPGHRDQRHVRRRFDFRRHLTSLGNSFVTFRSTEFVLLVEVRRLSVTKRRSKICRDVEILESNTGIKRK